MNTALNTLAPLDITLLCAAVVMLVTVAASRPLIFMVGCVALMMGCGIGGCATGVGTGAGG